jgi:hypothetical protein
MKNQNETQNASKQLWFLLYLHQNQLVLLHIRTWGAVFNGNPSKADIRKLLTKTANDVEKHKFLAHSIQLERQGDWTSWYEKVIEFDFSWTNLIYGPGNSLISFVLNATINTCRTPTLLKLWGYHATAACPICVADNCALHHILANCDTALNQRRYN